MALKWRTSGLSERGGGDGDGGMVRQSLAKFFHTCKVEVESFNFLDRAQPASSRPPRRRARRRLPPPALHTDWN